MQDILLYKRQVVREGRGRGNSRRRLVVRRLGLRSTEGTKICSQETSGKEAYRGTGNS